MNVAPSSAERIELRSHFIGQLDRENMYRALVEGEHGLVFEFKKGVSMSFRMRDLSDHVP